MKRKVSFKKLLSVAMTFALCMSMLIQGTLTVVAEEPLDSGPALVQEGGTSDSGESTEAENGQKKEDASESGDATDEVSKEDTAEKEEIPQEEASDENIPEAAPSEDGNQESAGPEEIQDGNGDVDGTASDEGPETDGVLEDAALEETADDTEKALDAMELLADSEDVEPLALDYIGVSDLAWDGNGVAQFKVNDSEPAFYVVALYRDGTSITKISLGDLSWSAGKIYHTDFKRDIANENSNYTFKIKISKDDSGDIWDFSMGQVSESSPEFEYVKPSEKLSTPTGLLWDSENKGTATWIPVENASKYFIRLYKDGEIIYGRTTNATKVDFSDQIGGEGSFTFTVQAITNDLTKWANSDWSEASAVLGDSSAVNETLEDIINKEDVNEAVNDLKNEEKVNRSELQIAMQTDSNVQGKMQEIEEKYIAENYVTVAAPSVEDVAIDAARIKMLGAALNAEPGQNVELKISKPATESPYNPDVYTNMVQFSMDMYINEQAVTELSIPVTITLPVPSGMNIDRLDILHYTSEGNYETIHPRNNGDGTVSFTITHFSIFAFAETAQTSGDVSDRTEDESGAVISTGAGSREESDSSESEQVQSWEPKTPDEIKRYACKGKEAVDYTLSKENAYPLVVMNAMQGPMCFASFEAVLGDYIIGRTYNIYPARNLTYSMAQEVQVTIKIPAAIYRADREYKMICVTQGGQPIILEDLDQDPETITFRTSKFYAFALIYK